MIAVRVIGADRVSAGLLAAAAGTVEGEKRLVTHFSAMLLTKVKANTSGRPGPRAITGDYRRSWGMSITHLPSGPAGTVGTNRPQGPRLENGFVGVDALGRQYDQPPYPHVGPACDEVEPLFQAAAAALVRSL